MRISDIDIDGAVRERVFQPLVDRLHIDPERGAWWIYRIHVMTLLTMYAGQCVMLVTGSPAAQSAIDTFVMFPVVGTISAFAIAVVLRDPAHPAADYLGSWLRLVYAPLAVIAVPLLGMTVFGQAVRQLRDAAGHTPMLLRLSSFSFCVAIIAAAACLYVRICRRPPPRKPKAARVSFAS